MAATKKTPAKGGKKAAEKAVEKTVEKIAEKAPAKAPVETPAKQPEVKVAPKAEAKPVVAPKETKVIAAPEAKAAVRPQATLAFAPGWRHDLKGELVAGGQLTISYDPARAQIQSPAKGTTPNWGVQVFVKFVPTSVVVEEPAVEFGASHTAKARPVTVEIPKGAREVQIWFKNWTNESRVAWDSNLGSNYRFAVRG